MSRKFMYSQLDVFAERLFEGNALAVFHDGRGLSDVEMQAFARETNLSETTFILPADAAVEERDGVRVRIFTTAEELPFAGHPTLGTATWLYLNHPRLRGAETIKLRLNVGTINVRFEAAADGVPGVRATMVQNDPNFGATHDCRGVATAIGLGEDDLLAAYRHRRCRRVCHSALCCCGPLRRVSGCRVRRVRRWLGWIRVMRIFFIALLLWVRRVRGRRSGMRGCSSIPGRILQLVQQQDVALHGW
jgi:trans-2,3-dihydro-3-hydroxyanthranilate isomerase